MIDKDWVEGTLGDIFETVTGNTPSKKDKDNYGSELPFIKPPQIKNNILKNYSEFLSKKGKIKARILPVNSILVTCIGNLGRVGMNKIEVAFNQQINAIKPLKEVEPKFTFYQAQSIGFKNQLERLSTSTTVALVNKTSFNSVRFKIAPLPVQRAIVAKIEELFSSLDSGITDLKKAQEQLKVYRQAVLKKAFEGELTKEWRQENKLQFDWENTTTGEVMTDISSGSTPKAEFLSTKGEIQFLKVYNLNFDGSLNDQKDPAFISKEIHRTRNKRAITKAGDVLINIVGPPLGKTSMIPLSSKLEFNINQAIVRFRSNEKILPKFLSFFLQNPETINWLEGTSKATAGQYNVKVTTCRVIPISLPNVSEQHQIVKEIESRLSVYDQVELTIKGSLKKAEALRQSILKKAFEGKLLSEVEIAKCKQAKDYEPASVLLQRIKKEKNG
ncbi:restriction endonuclease subunit S [Croceitalea marina]|uniref:Restriction endonuclease subunit S n=1 Tax=Croceitalea marina TaxID=1775166 RepID=A0ABW5MXN3_9FLAO